MVYNVPSFLYDLYMFSNFYIPYRCFPVLNICPKEGIHVTQTTWKHDLLIIVYVHE